MVVSNSSSLFTRPDYEVTYGHKGNSYIRNMYYTPECRKFVKRTLSRWRRRDHQRFIDEALASWNEQLENEAEEQHRLHQELWSEIYDDWNAYESFSTYDDSYVDYSDMPDYGGAYDYYDVDPYTLDWDGPYKSDNHTFEPYADEYARGYRRGHQAGYNEGFAAANRMIDRGV